MPEQIKSTFEEVIEIKLETKDFTEGIDTLKKKWKEFKDELGADAGNVLGAGMLGDIQKGFNTLVEKLAMLNDEMQKQNTDTVNNLKETVNKVLKVVEEGEKAKVALYQKTQQEKEALEKKAAEKAAGKLGGDGVPKFYKDLAIEQEGVLNRSDELAQKSAEKQKKLAEEIAIEQEGLIAKEEEAKAKSLEKQRRLAQEIALEQEGITAKSEEEKAKSLERQRKLAQEIALEQEGIAQREQENQLKLQEKQRKLARDIALEQEGVLNAQLEAQEKAARRQRELAKELAIEQEGIANKFDEGARAKAIEIEVEQEGILNNTLREKEKLLERQKVLRDQADSAGFKRLLAETTTTDGKLSLINTRLAELKEKLAALGKLGVVSPEDLEEIAAINKALEETKVLQAEIAALQNKANSLQKQSTLSVRSIGDELSKTLTITAKFYASFLLIQGVLDVLAAPFLALQKGLEYARETETAIVGLEATLLQNVKYSDDMVENFKEIKDQAKGVVEKLQEMAPELGVKPQILLNTFKALIAGGVGQYVKSMDDAIKVTVMFQQSLNAVGEGGLVAQSAISQVRELLLGENIDPNSPFLKALGLAGSPGQWLKIREEAKKTGDLIGTLAARSEPFRKQLEEVGKTQAFLIERFELLGKRMSEVAAKNLFESVNNALLRLDKLLNDNSSKLMILLTSIGDALGGIITYISMLTENSALVDFLGYVIVGFELLALALITIIDLVAELIGSITNLVTLDWDGLEARWEKFGERVSKSWAEASKKIQLDTQTTGDSLKKAFENIGTNTGNVAFPNNKTGIDREFENKRKEIDRLISEAENATQESKQQIEEMVAEGKLSAGDAAEQITQLATVQTEVVSELERKLLLALRDAKVKAGALFNADPQGSKELSAKYDGLLDDLQKGFGDRALRTAALISAAAKAAGKETVEIQKLTTLQKLTILNSQYDTELNLQRLSQSRGLTTQLQFFDAETKILDEKFAADQEILKQDAEQYGDGTKLKAEALAKLEKLEQDKANSDKVRIQQRIQVEQELRFAIQQTATEQQQSEISLIEARQETLSILEPMLKMTNILDNNLKLQYDALEPLRQQKQEYLSILVTAGAAQDVINKVQKELQDLEKQQVGLINNRLQNAVNGVDNPVVRRLLLQQAARKINAELPQDSANRVTASGAILGRSDIGGIFRDAVFGKNTFESIKGATGTFDKLAGATSLVVQGFNSVTDTINAFKQGFAQGGVLGGIGGVVGKFSQQLGAVPVVGPFISAIGGVLSIVGGLFVRGAKVIATSIKQAFEKTMEDFRNGNVNLVDTLAALQRERAEAISRLSGKKGGKSELDKLLPEIDKSIADLLRQQKEILTNFESQLDLLRLQNNTLETARKNWQDINKQVKEYIDAGGDAAKAGEFLSLKLQELRQGYIDELNSAEQEAIQNALKLNDLLEQRNKIVEDYKKQVFDLANADNIERRQAGSITRGNQIAQLKKDTDEKLAQIDREIKAAQARKDKEGEIFNLATDIADLHRRDEELSAAALDTQIDKLKTLKLLAEDITKGPNGLFASGGLLSGTNAINTNTFNITVNVTGVGEDIGGQVADAIMNEFDTRVRMGV